MKWNWLTHDCVPRPRDVRLRCAVCGRFLSRSLRFWPRMLKVRRA